MNRTKWRLPVILAVAAVASVRAEADAPSTPNALCQTGVGEFPAIALSDVVLDDLVMTSRFKPV